jgi:hypothetical protein
MLGAAALGRNTFGGGCSCLPVSLSAGADQNSTSGNNFLGKDNKF